MDSKQTYQNQICLPSSITKVYNGSVDQIQFYSAVIGVSNEQQSNIPISNMSANHDQNMLRWVMELSTPLSLWNMESLPATSFSALLDRASASPLWALGKWWNLMSAKSLDSTSVFSFQPLMWTERRLDLWLIQSMITLESPKTYKCLIDHEVAK